ncbi:MAG: Inosine-5'-monophosphate dehydrogenase [Chloroflexi bacterium]|nr:Inosine-5'-monophosphate dehydrogenase [Chloroflexota bacterium]
MLVGERMSRPIVTTTANVPIPEAHSLMRNNDIRRLPVVDEKGKLIGIISDNDIINVSPSPATSLSIWEMNYLINSIVVADIMTKDVFTVEEEETIEKAARIMADNKVGGLPVVREGAPVGVITETDLFKIFLELMGARDRGLRVTVLIPEKVGELAGLTGAISQAGGNFIAFGQFLGEDATNREVTFKVTGIEEEDLIEIVSPFVEKVKDMRIE